MVYKKKSKLEAMKELSKNIRKDIMDGLINGELFLVCDNNENKPFQMIKDSKENSFFDSRCLNYPISYECFEKIKNPLPLEKQGFQSFYKLKEDYIKEYKKQI